MTSRLTTFTNDGLTFDVIDEGPLDGVVVVLLHGFPQTASSWSALTPRLHELGYRTVAPTQRGYSRGARPRGRAAYRMSALVGDTVALVEAVDAGPVHLVGHDWGAAVAWSTAATRPDTVLTLTTLAVPHPLAFVRSMAGSTQALHSWYMAAFQLPWLPELVLSRRRQVGRALARTGMDQEQIERVLEEVVDAGGLRGGVNWYRAIPFTDPREIGRKVSVPTTHVWGSRDGFLSRKGAELAGDHVSGPFRLEVLDATHWVVDDQPAEVADIIDARVSSIG